jgi:hypothetical protein
MKPRYCWLIAGAVAAIACGQGGSGSAGPGIDSVVQSEDSLTFLQPAPNGPHFGDAMVSFYAVKGQRREARLMYRPLTGHSDSVEFARFRVDDRSLVNRPDGSPLATGDSILITLTLSDSTRLIAGFEPAGLQFNPSRPARLAIKYGEADPDLDHNGVVNAADSALVATFKIWRQEAPAEPWVSIPSSLSESALEVEADIYGFTRYAVAY